jgi:hypothetical protein
MTCKDENGASNEGSVGTILIAHLASWGITVFILFILKNNEKLRIACRWRLPNSGRL